MPYMCLAFFADMYWSVFHIGHGGHVRPTSAPEEAYNFAHLYALLQIGFYQGNVFDTYRHLESSGHCSILGGIMVLKMGGR
eukprot:5125526-Amphidinium_carterae.1